MRPVLKAVAEVNARRSPIVRTALLFLCLLATSALGQSFEMGLELDLPFAAIQATAPALSSVVISVSPQPLLFPLPKGVALYRATACSAVARVISAGMLTEAIEGAGLSVQDPSLNTAVLAGSTSKTPSSRALTLVKWLSVGMSVAGGIVTYEKSQATQVGNAKTWAEISVGTGALGAGLGILQPILQADINTQAVSVTTGVQAALLQSDGLYQVPANGCSKPIMFFGAADRTKPFQVNLP
jgi:hypothetical protein